VRFGGHAAAAGLTLRETDFAAFSAAFEASVQTFLTPVDLERSVETDGSLAAQHLTLETAAAIDAEVWGHGFPAPRFLDRFEVTAQRVVGGRHLKLKLRRDGRSYDAILFGSVEGLPAEVDAVYRLEVNEYRGLRGLQLNLELWKPPGTVQV
jgi:single-stranded-DNA-specific exonuclease